MTKVYFDGGCRPNPGQMETAVVARGMLHHIASRGPGSSELAEWQALLDAMAVARSLGIRDLLLIGDSIGVIRQARGQAACPSERTGAMREAFVEQARWFDRVRVRHIKRTQNLAGIALGQIRQGRMPGRRRVPDERGVSPGKR